jgi:hypothetical protein
VRHVSKASEIPEVSKTWIWILQVFVLKLWIFYLGTQTNHRVLSFFAAKTRKTARVPPHLACPDDLNKRWFPGDYHTFFGGYDGDIMGYTTNTID